MTITKLNSWELTETMSAELSQSNYTSTGKTYYSLRIQTTIDSEAMPDYSRNNPAPWYSVRDKITDINVYENISSIGSYAFINSSRVDYISIPQSVKSIGDGAFQGCTGLNRVSVEWKTPISLSKNVFADVNLDSVRLAIPKGIKRYQSADVWKDFGNIYEYNTLYISFSNLIMSFFHGILSFPNRIMSFFYGIVSFLDENLDEFSESSLDGFSGYVKVHFGDKERPIVWCIFILSVILFFMRSAKENDQPRQGATYVIYNILFLIVCVLEIMFAMIEPSLWFCDPDEVGWVWTVINFLLFGGILYNQYLCLLDVLNDVFANNKASCNLKLGFFSWIAGFICGLLCSFFYKAGLSWVLLGVVIMQIIQSILIFISYGKKVKGAVLCVIIYLLGTIGTAIIFVMFLSLAIIVAIFGFVLWGILNGKSASSSSDKSPSSNTISGELCSSCMYYPGGYGRNCSHRTAGDSRQVNDNTTACSYWRRS